MSGAEDRGVLLRIAYDGSGYHGFALQRNASPTVASALLGAIGALDPTVRELRVASRTDAGVHAKGQLVAFDSARRLPLRAWALELGHRLPDSIAVRAAWDVPRGYHPRFECREKRYRYLLHCERTPDPLLARRAWRLYGLSAASSDAIAHMAAELGSARGRHDFAAFASTNDRREHTMRTITATAVAPVAGSPLIAIDIAGDGFLHNMVRILAGTVVDVALGRIEPGAIGRALAGRDRRIAGQTAPPDGLYLEEVILRARPEGERWPAE